MDTGAISEDIENLIQGIYSVTINDEHGCETADTVQIFQQMLQLLVHFRNDITCNGGNDGNIYITVQGGRPPYTLNGQMKLGANLINVQQEAIQLLLQTKAIAIMNEYRTYQPEPFMLK